MSHYRFLIAAVLVLAFMPRPMQAQETLPALPAPLQNLVNEGAQIRYLGREYGFDSWLTVKNGQEQYFYVLPDGKAFVMGVLFDDKGKLVTVDQVQRLRENGDTLLDTLAEDSGGADAKQSAENDRFEFKTPAERLYHDIENSNWISLGQIGAPIAYAFIDPQCPHCHEFTQNLKPEIERGRLQLRMIPVGFKPETMAQAAFLLAAPNPQDRWMKHLDGDASALPARDDINQQGVQRNLAIMQSWKLTATPLIVYRGKDGEVKIVRGQPKDLPGMIADLGARR